MVYRMGDDLDRREIFVLISGVMCAAIAYFVAGNLKDRVARQKEEKFFYENSLLPNFQLLIQF